MSSNLNLDSSATVVIEAVLADMEKKRRASIFPAIWQGTLIGLVLTLISFFFVGELFISLSICLICAIRGMFIYKRSLLSNIYKKEIMPRLVATLGEGIAYSPEGGIDINTFRECHFFDVQSNDQNSAEDCVSGTIGKTKFIFSEASYSYKTKDDNDNDNEHIHTEFTGIGFKADFNKNFQGVTLLCPRRPSHLSRSEYPEIKLEDLMFSKLFHVYSTDEIEARYILTPALQERFVKLMDNIRRNSGEKNIKVAFYDSVILILINTAKNRFEARILSPLKLERVQQDFDMLQSMGGIVEELNLNTRIWTKQ